MEVKVHEGKNMKRKGESIWNYQSEVYGITKVKYMEMEVY